ncbi:MAG TPA: phospholipase D-like domain-containing protein [Nocardioidaceae bacterium]|nr:phospholipase D-like domain-containing protein [Nocardioidaceae bacterium]
MGLRMLLRRLLLTGLGLQALVIAGISIADGFRRWRRREASFPRTGPRTSTVGADQLTVYSYGEDLYADMLAAIRAAEHEICFESFMWKGDDLGQEFKTALTDASARGVEVFVIYDGFANLVVPASFKQFAPAIQVLRYPVFAPGWRIYDPRQYGRVHYKVLVVDGEVGFVGGYNIGSLFATDWRDTHVRIAGPSAWHLKNAFIDIWNANRGPHHVRLHDPGTSSWESRIRVYRNVPRQRLFPIRGMYIEAVDRARQHIYLTHAYFVPDQGILAALVEAAGRGVDVRVLLPATSNHVVMDWLSRGFYSDLLRGGVRVFLFENAMIHAKTATIDGQWATIGTANVDRMSLTGNYEINAEFFDAGLAHHLEETFATDCTQARELSLAEWRRRSVVVKLSEAVLAPLRPLL